MVLSFDEVGSLLDEAAETFPPALFEGLNGGVNLLEDTVRDPEFLEGDVFLMGVYCNDMMGNYINLHYGSFAALAKIEDWTREDWVRELRVTFSHELTHHMEGRAGADELGHRDEEQMEIYRRAHRKQD